MESERIILIQQYLSRYAVEPPGVTIKQVREYIRENSNLTDASVQTIRRDLEALSMLEDIRITNGAHNTAYYQYVSGGFTFNEIRFLVDSVSINKFLSDGAKQKLIKKFEGLCSEQQIRMLISRIHLTHQTPSSDLLNNLDIIHRMIAEKRRINFEYGKNDLRGEMHYQYKDRNFVPAEVVYFENRFYLRGVNPETGEPRTYRIDRMRRIKEGEQVKKVPKLPKQEGAVLDMFGAERQADIVLRVKRTLVDEMQEQFGRNVNIRDDAEHADCVLVRARVGISRNFTSWVLRYGGDAELLEPADLREEMREKLAALLGKYQG
ncbi:MAG: WYL domain-containing protein [Oscillospiraceae bacterium]|nr:WYL domain-containing protein [Oscillospiraceae bacterium]